MPRFDDASYDGETVGLRNDEIRLDVHRRPDGFGWGELFAPTGDGDDAFLGVLEHLAEIDIERFPHPLHLTADDVEVRADGTELVFDLRPRDLAEIEGFRDDDYDADPEVTGTLELSLADNDGCIEYDLSVEANDDVELTRLRGPWLRFGASGAGTARDDAILPGVEWVTGDEWSSGTDYIEHPEALCVAPHPNKVTMPTMAISNDDVGVGLSWDVSRVDEDVGRPQPVFASPNFVDRRNDSLLGVMLPGADGTLSENELNADDPIELDAGDGLSLSAELTVTDGSSLDVLVDEVQAAGFPEPPEPRYDLAEFHHWVAECYDTSLWQEGEGFGADVEMLDGGSPQAPEFVREYVERDDADPELVESLEDKIEWCEAQQDGADDEGEPSFDLGRPLSVARSVDEADADALGEQLLEIRREDGAFTYDPDGRHDDFRLEWLDHSRPLGQPGETDLGFCVEGGAALLLVGRMTGEDTYTDAGLETLEFALQFDKPAGDDWWETPIHGPNLFAGGKAAVAYALAHEETGAEHYRDRAVYWFRSLLAFTHFWEHEEMDMLYNTKPCLVSSIWTVVSWVNNHVIWEVLSVFSTMDDLGIDWAELDPELDWDTYHEGITVAVLRWFIDSRADEEFLDRFQFPEEETKAGEYDGLYADIHDPIEGAYAGGPITPDDVAKNVSILLERRD